MFYLEESASKIEEHLNGCEEMKTPFLWELSQSAENEGLYNLACNGRTVLVAPLGHFPDIEKLNEWQVTPFERVSGEHMYKYDFQTHFGDSLEFLLRDIDELREKVNDNTAIVERGSPYLSATTTGEYKAALAKLDAAVANAREAAESIKSMNADEELECWTTFKVTRPCE
jgi:hypothetical protein